MMKRTFIFIWFLGFTMVLHAQIQLPHFFADHMVLQREMPIPIWGTAPALSKITVKFNKQKISTTTDANGIWMVKMKAEKAGGPYTLKVTGFNKIIIKDVLIGDVWLCTGQSNMEWTVGQSDGYEQERMAATQSNIRHLKIEHHTDFAPLDDILDTQWQVCSPETVGKFSGVGYFFAQKIYGEQNVPIGLINASWGGTNIETWISREAFMQSEEYHDMIVKMPNLNTTELEALKIKHIEEIQNLALQDFSAANFINPTFDDTNCPSIEQPKIWEEQIIGNMDGIVWIRKTFELTADEAQQKAILKLSKIDDFDTTYINGVEVGQTQQWDIFRNYTLKPGVLKEGKNVIVIKITDNTGGGGIYGAEKDVALALESKTLSLAGFWKFQVEKVIFSTQENAYPSIAYNAMIHPLKSLAIKGVLWYQGESNASRAYQYRTAFPLLIEDWRKHFNQVNLPFYYVNLATYKTDGNSNIGDGWCELREAQAMTLSVPHTGMVVTTDIGNPNDIHPTNKKEVGKRLANIALHELYGKNVIYNGPSFERMEIKGNQVLVTFKDVADGLKTKGNSQVLGFEIAGADQVFYPAQAQIVNQIVVVYSDQVTQPLAVRFGWLGDDEACNLFNSADLPAVPFRTDDWKTLTKGIKYKL